MIDFTAVLCCCFLLLEKKEKQMNGGLDVWQETYPDVSWVNPSKSLRVLERCKIQFPKVKEAKIRGFGLIFRVLEHHLAQATNYQNCDWII